MAPKSFGFSPVETEGVISMLCPKPDGSAEVVTWRHGAWVTGLADVSDVMKGRSLSPEEIERAGIWLPPPE